MNEFLRRLRFLFNRNKFDRELEEEMQHHLALMAEHNKFGNITLLKEDSRTMWTFVFWEQLAQDIRYSFRAMSANKLFTAMAVLSLALGIGANTAIYSFMDAIMLRALPVRKPGDLVILNWRAHSDPAIVQSHWGENYDEPGGTISSPNHPYPAYELMRDQNKVLTSLFGHAGGGRLNVVVDGQAELATGQYVTGDYFSGLGIAPVAGSLITRNDDRAGAPSIAVITYDYWRSRFAGNSTVIGKAVQINGTPFTIAGVSAPDFYGVSPGNKPSVFLPMSTMGTTESRTSWDARRSQGTYYWIELMGRLKPGVTMLAAQAQLSVLYQGFIESTITQDRERTNIPALWLQEGGSGFDSMRRQYSKPLMVLMGMVGLILAIACANIANLLLARSSARRREMAVRLSLGAGRSRVIRQLLTESVMLALIGGAAGTGFAVLGIRALRFLLTNGTNDFSVQVGLDWRVLGFTLAVALVTGLLFGIAPALHAVKINVTPALKESRSGGPRTRTFGLSQILVVSQIAISLLLVIAAGLFVRTVSNLHSVNLGFNSENVLLFSLDASKAGYKGIASMQFYTDLRERFLHIPGVRSATLTDGPMVSGWGNRTGVKIAGMPKPAEGRRGPSASFAEVGPSFFETMEIPLINGRGISERDIEGAPRVAVVNEVFAKQYFPAVNPVGQHFGLGGDSAVDLEIVGLAKNARYESLKREVPAVVYTSYRQERLPARPHQMYYELRTVGNPLALAGALRQVVRQVAPKVPVADLSTQAKSIDATIMEERTFAQLCTCFGVLALVMACVGLYGTMAYKVARRTSEIGIRMALGAERRRIVWMVLREVLGLAAVGLTIGFVAAWQSTELVKSFLFGLKPNDPVAMGASVAILAICALAAGYAPAWKASKIDPMTALRHE